MGTASNNAIAYDIGEARALQAAMPKIEAVREQTQGPSSGNMQTSSEYKMRR
jgi:hypothetical protein